MYTSNTGVDVKTKFMTKGIVKKWCWQVRVPRRKTQTCSLWWWNIWQKQCIRGKVYFVLHFREVTPPRRDRHGATTLFTSWWARKQKGDAVTSGILFFFSFYSTQDPSPWDSVTNNPPSVNHLCKQMSPEVCLICLPGDSISRCKRISYGLITGTYMEVYNGWPMPTPLNCVWKFAF